MGGTKTKLHPLHSFNKSVHFVSLATKIVPQSCCKTMSSTDLESAIFKDIIFFLLTFFSFPLIVKNQRILKWKIKITHKSINLVKTINTYILPDLSFLYNH